MAIEVGERIPDVTVRTMTDGKPEPKRDLRGGTGTAGPLFQLPGDENKG